MDKKNNDIEQPRSELKHLRERLFSCRKQFYNVVDRNRDGILILDRQGEIMYANQAAQRILNRNIGKLLGEPFGVLVEGDYETIIPIPSNKGDFLHAQLLVSTIEWNQESSTLVFIHDNSGRKKMEERIKKSLEEKEILLKEIHHRVKNNLQLVSSLLSMPMKSIKDEKALLVFKDCQERLSSISLVHEDLYRSDDLANIDYPEYVRRLVMGLFKSYYRPSSQVQLRLEVENISLDIDNAIPIGLIINELVSNSLKHAFPDQSRGELHVKLGKSYNGTGKGEDNYVLVVRDNGIGFPEEIDYHKSGSFGLILVNALVKQLHGVLTINREKGTQVTIKFKPRDSRSRS